MNSNNKVKPSAVAQHPHLGGSISSQEVKPLESLSDNFVCKAFYEPMDIRAVTNYVTLCAVQPYFAYQKLIVIRLRREPLGLWQFRFAFLQLLFDFRRVGCF